MRSLDCTSRALVDACSALCADACVDDSDIADGDCSGRTCICACSACDTICFFDCRHFNNL